MELSTKINGLVCSWNFFHITQFEQFILFKFQKVIDPSGNINI